MSLKTVAGYVIGVDLGTSSCKVVAFDLDGRKLASASASYATRIDSQGGMRQAPESWWLAFLGATRKTLTSLAAGKVLGIGLSGQIGTAAPRQRLPAACRRLDLAGRAFRHSVTLDRCAHR